MSHALITHILAFLTHREAISQDDRSSGIRSAKPDKAHQLIVNTYRHPPKYTPQSCDENCFKNVTAVLVF